MCVSYARDAGRKYWKGGYSMGGWERDGRVFVASKGGLRSFVVLSLSIGFFVHFRWDEHVYEGGFVSALLVGIRPSVLGGLS